MGISAKRSHHFYQSLAIHRSLCGGAGRSDRDDLTRTETESGTAGLVEVLPRRHVAGQHSVLWKAFERVGLGAYRLGVLS